MKLSHLKQIAVIISLLLSAKAIRAQSYLGKNSEELLLTFKQCVPAGKYDTELALNCSGRKALFYFKSKNGPCDLYAMDLEAQNAKDTIQALLKNGFAMKGTKYVEAFLVSKNTNHQKFPSRIYSDGKMRYCFLPVSLSGKSADLNSMIVMYESK